MHIILATGADRFWSRRMADALKLTEEMGPVIRYELNVTQNTWMIIGAEIRGRSHNIRNSNAANISKGKNASSVLYEKKRRYHGRAAAIAAASAAACLAASALALASAVRGGGRRVMLAVRSYSISIALLQPMSCRCRYVKCGKFRSPLMPNAFALRRS